MKVKNIHERKMAYPASAVGALIDTLASENDKLWPICSSFRRGLNFAPLCGLL